MYSILFSAFDKLLVCINQHRLQKEANLVMVEMHQFIYIYIYEQGDIYYMGFF